MSARETAVIPGGDSRYQEGTEKLSIGMRRNCRPLGHDGALPGVPSVPIIFATIFHEEGGTGVHTHIQQLRRYLSQCGTPTAVVTPFSWGRPLTYPVFAPRRFLARLSGPASVVWYRHWHEVFLRNALQRRLAGVGDCVVYAQGPLEARAALHARRGPSQRVVMAVHFRASQADEYAEPGREIERDGTVFQAIRQLEREVTPRVDGIVYVSEWARDALLGWLPEATAVRSAVIGNFVAPLDREPSREPHGDLVTTGRLEERKNHRFLLAVLAEAKQAGRIFTLDIFGDGPLRKSLPRLAHSLGVDQQVRFRGFRADVPRLLPGYRAYVHAAYAETSSLAIMEAMAAGLPVVAGGIGPIPELCDDGVEARFWPLDDSAQAAATLIELLDCEPVRLKAAVAASERFRRDFDAGRIAPRLRSFLLDCGSPRPPGGGSCAGRLCQWRPGSMRGCEMRSASGRTSRPRSSVLWEPSGLSTWSRAGCTTSSTMTSPTGARNPSVRHW
jgi:glycosyltransferase involved in cell wall biosynthesis